MLRPIKGSASRRSIVINGSFGIGSESPGSVFFDDTVSGWLSIRVVVSDRNGNTGWGNVSDSTNTPGVAWVVRRPMI